MSLRTGLAGVAALMLPLGAAVAQESAAAGEPTLQQQVEEQKQRLLILERKLELQEEAAATAKKEAAVVKAAGGKFSFQSAEGANVIKLRGVLHVDGRRYNDDITSETADTFLLRRVRPTLEGTVGGIYDFRFTPDFAGGRTIILDAFATARLRPWAVVTAGKFKVPVGLERLQSASDIRFIERAFPTSLLPNRDLGVQLSGDVSGGVLNYSVGYFNGVTDGGSSDGNTRDGLAASDIENDTKGDWAARIFLQPFLNSDSFALRGLGFGVGATYVDVSGSPTTTLLTSYRTPGQQGFFNYRSSTAATATTPLVPNGTYADGERLRITPQFHYYVGQFGLLGEYAQVSQDVTRTNGVVTRSDSLDTTAWHLQFSWFLTREEQAFKGFTPGSTFEPGKPGRGAWELVARIHELTLDDAAFEGGGDSFANPSTSARKASALGVGVNWYLNQNVKWSLNYEETQFDGGAVDGGDRPDEKVLLTRVGVAF
jgi:phosphate-selective porin OprO/OprP